MRNPTILPSIAVAAFACTLGAATLIGSGPAFAQVAAPANPTMTNVIPDGGSFAVNGRVTAINADARTLTIAPSSGAPVPMVAPASVSLADISTDDIVSAHYSRTVTFVVGTPQAETPSATATVSEVARTPGGIGPGAEVIVGRVVKVDGPGAVDIVNVTGGGLYSIRATDPSRVAALAAVRVGDSVTASIGPFTVTSIATCSMFGLIC
jgi:hypothetical protein